MRASTLRSDRSARASLPGKRRTAAIGLRDADLHDADFRVRRVTWRQLTETPGAVADRLRRALANG